MAKKPSDSEQVEQYMGRLEHPMKVEIERLRAIIRATSDQLSERIKWNAPSYYYREDIVTFGPPARKQDEVMLVFHHPSVVEISSPILEGNYKDRRLVIFKNMLEVETNQAELAHILHEIIAAIDASV